MITYSELFQFCLVIIGVIGLFLTNKRRQPHTITAHGVPQLEIASGTTATDTASRLSWLQYTRKERKKSIAEQEKAKRKTHTSTAVKNRYNAKTYDQIVIKVRKEKSAAYKAKCDELGITYSEPLHKAIDEILNK